MQAEGSKLNRGDGKMKVEIRKQNGEVRSTHKSYESAEKKHKKDLNWCCGICGSNNKGWGECKHGNQNRVCAAEFYNDKIVIVEN